MKKLLIVGTLAVAILGGFFGTARAAQIYDLASSTNWTYRIDGEADSGLGSSVIYQDINNDGMKDLIVSEVFAGHNGATSGSIFIIYSTLLDTFTPGSIINLVPL